MTVEINHDMEIKEMIRENLLLTKDIHEMTRKIKRHITFQKIMSIIYFIIIVVPLILSIIYLPPLLKTIFEPYKELLGPGASGLINELLLGGIGGDLDLEALSGADPGNIDIDNLPPALRQALPAGVDPDNIDINSLPPELQKLLKK